MKHKYTYRYTLGILIFLTFDTLLAKPIAESALDSNAFLERVLEEELRQQIINEKRITKIKQQVRLLEVKTLLGKAKEKCRDSGGCAKPTIKPNIFTLKPIKPIKPIVVNKLSLDPEEVEVDFTLSTLTDKYAYFNSIQGRYQVGEKVANGWILETLSSDSVVLKKTESVSGASTIKRQTILFNW